MGGACDTLMWHNYQDTCDLVTPLLPTRWVGDEEGRFKKLREVGSLSVQGRGNDSKYLQNPPKNH